MRLMYDSLAAVLFLLLTITGGLADIDPFAGSWTNVDPNTRGIIKLDISIIGTTVQVQGWGSCTPTYCDWGTVQAQAFTSSASSDILHGTDILIAVFDAGFSETTLVIKLTGNRLNVDSYDRFKDNSGRSNYLASYAFQKA
jgi:hypothetical protein